jgi:hypothetical protein
MVGRWCEAITFVFPSNLVPLPVAYLRHCPSHPREPTRATSPCNIYSRWSALLRPFFSPHPPTSPSYVLNLAHIFPCWLMSLFLVELCTPKEVPVVGFVPPSDLL